MTLQTLLDDIINTVNELVFRAVNAIEEGLTQAKPEVLGFRLADASSTTNTPTSTTTTDMSTREEQLSTLKQNEVDSGIIALESLLNATVDKDFDKFEIYTLRNILAVGGGKGEEDLARCAQISYPMRSGFLWLCACRRLREDNKEEKSWWT